MPRLSTNCLKLDTDHLPKFFVVVYTIVCLRFSKYCLMYVHFDGKLAKVTSKVI